MCVSGKIRWTDTTNGNFTNNQEYPVLGLAPGSSGTYPAVAITVDDNGEVVESGRLEGAQWQVVELYAPTRVI